MLTQTLHCTHCGSSHLVSNGHAKNGKLRFQCRDCKKYGRQNPSANGYDEQTKATILAAYIARAITSYHERPSIRGLRRVFGVARNTVSGWLKTEVLKSQPVATPGNNSDATPARRTAGTGRTLVFRGPAQE